MELRRTPKIGALSLAALSLLTWGQNAWGGWGLIPAPRFQSGREAALGGAYLPIGEDVASALFNNPADASKFKNSRLDALNLVLYGNKGYLDSLSFGLQGTNALDVLSLQGNAANLRNRPGSISGMGTSVMTGYAFKQYFAVGLLWQNNFAASSDGTNVTYRSMYQLIPSASAGLRLASGIVRLGYNIQWVNQAVTPVTGVTVSHEAASMSYASSLLQGSGFAHSVGFSMTLPFQMLPSFNFVARNIGGTKYDMPSLLAFSPDPSGTPPTESMSMDTSVSIQPKLGGGIYMNCVVQLRDIANTSNVELMGRLSTGVELAVRDRFFVRAGWQSHYPSIGFGIRHGKGDVNFTYYNEDYGSQFNGVREPRFLLQFLMRAH